MNKSVKKLVTASMFATLCCIATMVIKIPSPMKGYINLGDCIVLLTGWFLSPAYGFAAAGIGSALADVFSGYVLYAPATFVIKGIMAIICNIFANKIAKSKGNFSLRLTGGIIAEIIMVAGYYLFEGFLYGFAASLVNVPANAVQGVAGLIIGLVLAKIFDKIKI